MPDGPDFSSMSDEQLQAHVQLLRAQKEAAPLPTADQFSSMSDDELREAVGRLRQAKLAPYIQEAQQAEAKAERTAPWSRERLMDPGLQHNYLMRQVFKVAQPIHDYQHDQAMAKFNRGEESEDDLRLIAKRQLQEHLDAQRTGPEKLAGGVMALPGQVAEIMAGGRLASTAGAAGTELAGGAQVAARIPAAVRFAGTTAAQAALTPNLGPAAVMQQNREAGRDPLDARGLAPGMEKAMAEAAVLHGAGKFWSKALPTSSVAGGYAVAGLTGPISQQVTDLTTYTLGLNSRYGRLQDIAEGKHGEALSSALLESLTFMALHPMHGGEAGESRKLADAAKETLDVYAKAGVPADTAAADLTKIHARITRMRERGMTEDRAGAMFRDIPEGPLRDYADRLAGLSLESPPVGQAGARQRGPGTIPPFANVRERSRTASEQPAEPGPAEQASPTGTEPPVAESNTSPDRWTDAEKAEMARGLGLKSAKELDRLPPATLAALERTAVASRNAPRGPQVIRPVPAEPEPVRPVEEPPAAEPDPVTGMYGEQDADPMIAMGGEGLTRFEERFREDMRRQKMPEAEIEAQLERMTWEGQQRRIAEARAQANARRAARGELPLAGGEQPQEAAQAAPGSTISPTPPTAPEAAPPAAPAAGEAVYHITDYKEPAKSAETALTILGRKGSGPRPLETWDAGVGKGGGAGFEANFKPGHVGFEFDTQTFTGTLDRGSEGKPQGRGTSTDPLRYNPGLKRVIYRGRESDPSYGKLQEMVAEINKERADPALMKEYGREPMEAVKLDLVGRKPGEAAWTGEERRKAAEPVKAAEPSHPSPLSEAERQTAIDELVAQQKADLKAQRKGDSGLSTAEDAREGQVVSDSLNRQIDAADLKPNEANILKRLLRAGSTDSLRPLAAELGLSHEWVRQLAKRAIKKIDPTAESVESLLSNERLRAVERRRDAMKGITDELQRLHGEINDAERDDAADAERRGDDPASLRRAVEQTVRAEAQVPEAHAAGEGTPPGPAAPPAGPAEAPAAVQQPATTTPADAGGGPPRSDLISEADNARWREYFEEKLQSGMSRSQAELETVRFASRRLDYIINSKVDSARSRGASKAEIQEIGRTLRQESDRLDALAKTLEQTATQPGGGPAGGNVLKTDLFGRVLPKTFSKPAGSQQSAFQGRPDIPYSGGEWMAAADDLAADMGMTAKKTQPNIAEIGGKRYRVEFVDNDWKLTPEKAESLKPAWNIPQRRVFERDLPDLGVSAAQYHQAADAVIAEDKSTLADRIEKWQTATDALKAHGGQPRTREGKETNDEWPGQDEVAESLGISEDEMRALVLNGRPKPITMKEAYAKAYDQIASAQAAAAESQDKAAARQAGFAAGATESARALGHALADARVDEATPDEIDRELHGLGDAAEPAGGSGDFDPGEFGRPLTDAERAAGNIGGGQDDAERRTAPQRVTALANEVTDRERQANGLPPLLKAARQSNPESWDRAMARLDADPQAGAKLVDELAAKNRPTSVEENALLLQRKVALGNEYERSVRGLLDAYAKVRNKAADAPSAADIASLEAGERDLLDKLDKLDKVTKATGTEWGRAGQFRRQLAAEDFSLAGMLRSAEAAKGEPLSEAERQQITDLQAQITALQTQLNTAQDALAASGKGAKGATFKPWEKAQVDLNTATGKFKDQLQAYREAQKPWHQKLQDLIVRWRRFGVLTSVAAIPKIGFAAAEQLAVTPITEGVGAVLSRIPGLSKIAAMAPREGRGFSREVEQRAFMSAFTEGMVDAWKTLKTGQSPLDLLHGTAEPEMQSGGFMGWPGRLHAAIKAPAKRAEYTRSFLQRLDAEAAAGRDVTAPGNLMRVGFEAYKDSNRAVFREDNKVVDAYNRAVSTLEKGGPGARALATGAKLALPVVRVPTNLVGQAIEYTFGSVTGLTKLGVALSRGTESLTPQQADTIMRQLKRGSLGAAAFAIGALLPGQFGGFSSGKRKKDELEAMGVQTPAGKVGGNYLHHPLFYTAQAGATFRREIDRSLKKRDTSEEATENAAGNVVAGLVDETPFGREMKDVARDMDAKEKGHTFGEFAKSLAVPQLFQWLAKGLDKPQPFNSQQQPVKRYPRGVGENIETGVPWARERVSAVKK